MSEKLKIKIYDTNFAHHSPGSSISSFPGQDIYPKYIEWIRDPNVECDFAFFTDNCLSEVDNCNSKWKFAWVIEPKELVPNVYHQISNPELYNKFTKVLTHDEELLKLNSNKFEQYVFGGAWIKNQDIKYYPKTKNVCIIASHKRETEGHRLRHEVIEKLSKKHNIDVFGNGYQKFDQMVDVLKDYRYNLIIENCKKNFWLTEKLTTSILCSCIPIYWGTDFNDKIFLSDKYGIYKFNNIEGLDRLLPLMTEELYDHHLNEQDIMFNCMSIDDKYKVCEDWISEWFLYPWMKENGLLKGTNWE